MQKCVLCVIQVHWTLLISDIMLVISGNYRNSFVSEFSLTCCSCVCKSTGFWCKVWLEHDLLLLGKSWLYWSEIVIGHSFTQIVLVHLQSVALYIYICIVIVFHTVTMCFFSIYRTIVFFHREVAQDFFCH